MGLIYIYLLTIIAFVGSLALVIWASGELFNFDSSASKAWGVLTATGITIIVSMLLLFETVVYWSNRLVLMDDEIRQTLQKGLLNRKISSLGLANIEDVTIEQKGFMATLFNYGTLLIETAGEQSCRYGKQLLVQHAVQSDGARVELSDGRPGVRIGPVFEAPSGLR